MDAFAQGTQKGRRTFKEAMEEVNLEREEKEVQQAVEKKIETAKQEQKQEKPAKRSRRWDVAPAEVAAASSSAGGGHVSSVKSEPKGEVDLDDLEEDVKKRSKSQWDDDEDKRKGVGATPQKRASRWDQTPVLGTKVSSRSLQHVCNALTLYSFPFCSRHARVGMKRPWWAVAR
jgi:hypothetical protein